MLLPVAGQHTHCRAGDVRLGHRRRENLDYTTKLRRASGLPALGCTLHGLEPMSPGHHSSQAE